MPLSADIVSQFAKVTKDQTPAKSEQTVYGTVVVYNDKKYVKLDGSELLTPISLTSKVENEDRVIVMIKDHTAIVTGNMTAPSASDKDVIHVGDKISEFEIVIADKVDTLEFNAQVGRIDDLTTDYLTVKDSLTATNASIKNLEAKNLEVTGKLEAVDATIEKLEAEDVVINGKLEANDADIDSIQADNVLIRNELNAANANISKLEADNVTINNTLNAHKASIDEIDAKMITVDDLDAKYANIDFSNIGNAAMEYFYAKSGLIDNVKIGDATITGSLVGVTIKGDLIEGGTVKADKLVILGEDGLYYKLNTNGETVETEQTEYNSINGQVIIANSITASKIDVDDLVAFDATIGGFRITQHSLYSGVKESSDNTTRGIYLDDGGQLVVGDATNYVKYYRVSDDVYKLEIRADILRFGTDGDSVEERVESVTDTAAEAQASSDTTAAMMQSALLEIDKIKNTISTLVTGQNGESLMVQTENGWTFNMKSVLDALNNNSNSIDNLTNGLSDTNHQIEVLDQAVVDLGEYTGYIKFAMDGGHPCIILGEESNEYKVVIANTGIRLMDGTKSPAKIINNLIDIENARIRGGLRQGNFIWQARSNGNYGLIWRDD